MAAKAEPTLEEQLEIARRDVANLAKLAGERARERTVEPSRAALEHLSEEARTAYRTAMSEGEKMRGVAEERIREQPIGSVALAFLAGAAITTIMGRK